MARKETSKDRAVAARNARRDERKKHESEQLTRDARLGEERRDMAAGKTRDNGSSQNTAASTSTPVRSQTTITPAQSSSARITSAPAFLIPFAQKINKLQEQRNKITGGPGIEVKVSSGNTVISALDGTGGGSEGDAIGVVGSDGKLNLVPKHSTWVTPTAYPTVLKSVNGSTNVLIDSSGLTITNSSGKTCTISFSALTQNMAIKTVTVCDSLTGTQKSMLVLASDAF